MHICLLVFKFDCDICMAILVLCLWLFLKDRYTMALVLCITSFCQIFFSDFFSCDVKRLVTVFVMKKHTNLLTILTGYKFPWGKKLPLAC